MYRPSILQPGLKRGPGALRAKKQRQQQGEPDIVPPPPPTVAPPQGPPRKPLERSAYRHTRKTEEQREQQRTRAAAAARSAGRTRYLDSHALQERHAAAATSATSSLAGQQGPAAARFRTSVTATAAVVTVIDGYNFLHYHPTTKQLLSANRVDEARALLHRLLGLYAAEQKQDVLVVYDATTVSSTGDDRVSRVSDNVQVMFRAGHEADNVIITAVADLQQQSAAAVAAGVPARAAAGRRVVVVTNDRRIQAECSNADVHHGSGSSVFCQSNRQLSKDLQQLENRLARFTKGVKVDNSAAAAAAVAAAAAYARSRATVDVDQDSYAWATNVLQMNNSSISTGSRKQLRHRQPQQQQQQQQQQQHSPEPHSPELLLSDEELLLQAKAAEAAAAGHVPSGVIASSTSQALDELLLLDDFDAFV